MPETTRTESRELRMWKPVGTVVLMLLLAGCDALTSPQHRLERARHDLDAGKFGSAGIGLRKLVQADPRNAQAWVLLARWSLDVGQAGDAPGELDRATKAGAQGPEVDALRVRTWLAMGQPKAVIDGIAHHTLALPEPDRTVALAHAYNQLRQFDRALAVLQPLMAAHTSSTEARLAAATALWREGKADAAMQTIDTAMADRSSFAAPLLKAEIAQRQGRLPLAEENFALAVQRLPRSAPTAQRAEALAGLTDVRLTLGKTEEAAKSEAPLERLLPRWPRTQLLSGRLKIARHDYLNGIADLERVVAHAPDFQEARLLLATAQVQRGDLEQARSNLEELIRQAPGNVGARKVLAQVQLKLNEPQDALRALAPALGTKLMDPQLYTLLSDVENKVGNPNSVLDALERSLQAHPENRALRLNLAEAYLGASRPKDALQTLQGMRADPADDMRREGLLIAALAGAQGPAAASAEVDKMLAGHPHDARVLNLAASFFLSRGETDHARTLLLQALELKPNDVASLVNLARTDAAAGDTQAAEDLLRKALAQDQSNQRVRTALADLLVRRKAFTDAERLLQAATDPRSLDVQFALAQVALARGDLKEANAALDRAVATRPGSAELVNQAGLLLFAAKQYEPALARFREATTLVADNAGLWFNTARAQLALNQSAAARESLEKANKLQPEWEAPVAALSLLDLQAKHPASALERVKALVAKNPGDPQALVLQGDVEQSLGQFPDAIASYTEAQRRRPEASVVERIYVARTRAKMKNPEEPLQQWLADHPGDAGVRTLLGDYYLGQRQLPQAAHQFEAVVAQAPNNIVALNNLAWVYQELQDARAEGTAERAYKLAPAAPTVDDTLGWILVHKHSTDRGLALLEKAAQARASDPDMQYHYAYALAAAGKRAQAREVLSKVLAGKQDFGSRHDAERLLANLKA